MLRQLFLRLRKVNEPIYLIRRNSNVVNSIFHQDAIRKHAALDRPKETPNEGISEPIRPTFEFDKEIEQEIIEKDKSEIKEFYDIKELNDLMKNIEEYEEICDILNGIKPHLDCLSQHNIFLVYHRINYLLIKSKRFRIGDPKERPFHQNINAIQTSPVFDALLNRSINLIEKLSFDCLLQMINMFSLTYLRTDDNAVVCVIKNLESRLHSCVLNDLLNLLKILNSYIRHINAFNIKANNCVLNLMKLTLEKTKKKLQSYSFSDEEVSVLCKAFNLFLSLGEENENIDIISHLNKLLILNKNRFNLKQSVKLLKSIILAQRQYGKAIDFNQFKELISKCNKSISEILIKAPLTHNALYYATNLHSVRNQPGFDIDNFYDPKILELIAPILIEESYLQTNAKHLILTMNYNFSRQQIFNERFLMYLFDLVSRNTMFRAQISLRAFFELYTLYRLPFVNYQEVANLVEEKFNQLEKISDVKTTSLMTLSSLILNDALINKNLFTMFDNLITKNLNDKDATKQFKVQQINQVLNSAIYLSMFGKMDDDLKNEILEKMEKWILKILVENPFKIMQFTHDCSNKALHFTYLSNGVFIGTVMIYDESLKNIISMEGYSQYTQKIEEIPLTRDQQLVAFVRAYRLRGDISRQYENTYHYSLRRITEHYNIKLIKIYHDEIKKFAKEKSINFFIKKTLEFFTS